MEKPRSRLVSYDLYRNIFPRGEIFSARRGSGSKKICGLYLSTILWENDYAALSIDFRRDSAAPKCPTLRGPQGRFIKDARRAKASVGGPGGHGPPEIFLKIAFKMVLSQGNFKHIRRSIAACNTRHLHCLPMHENNKTIFKHFLIILNWRPRESSLFISNVLMFWQKKTLLYMWFIALMYNVHTYFPRRAEPIAGGPPEFFLKIGFEMVLVRADFKHITRNIAAYITCYLSTLCMKIIRLFSDVSEARRAEPIAGAVVHWNFFWK